MKNLGFNAFASATGNLKTQTKPLTQPSNTKRSKVGGMSVSSFVNLIRSSEPQREQNQASYFGQLDLKS